MPSCSGCSRIAPEPAGSTYAYSNVGYALAGLMAEQVTGESWESLLMRRLFEPLGMASAGFGSPGRRGDVEPALGPSSLGNEIKPTQQDNAPSLGPAGTVHCTVPDWAKFAALHLGGDPGKAKLLKPATFRALAYASARKRLRRRLARLRTLLGRRLALNHNGSNTSWYRHDLDRAGSEFRHPRRDQPGRRPSREGLRPGVGKLIEALRVPHLNTLFG